MKQEDKIADSLDQTEGSIPQEADFDLDDLASPMNVSEIEVEKVRTSVRFSKPRKSEFFRSRPSTPGYSKELLVFKPDDSMNLGGRLFVVTNSIAPSFPSKLGAVRCRLLVTLDGEPIICPVPFGQFGQSTNNYKSNTT